MTSRTDGAIGYVEYAYALQNKMTYALLQNRDGNFVTPDIKSFQAAAANADWTKAPGFDLLLTNQPGKDSWPITGATFILMHKQQEEPRNGEARCSTSSTGPTATATRWREELDYVPMPESVVKLVEESWKQESSAPTASRYGPGRVLSLSRNASRRDHRSSIQRAISRRERVPAGMPGRPDEQSRRPDEAAMTAETACRRGSPPRASRRGALADRAFHGADAFFALLVLLVLVRRHRRAGRRRGAGAASIRLRFPRHRRLEPGHREIRRAGADLRHARHLGDRDADRHSGRVRGRAVHHRDCARSG